MITADTADDRALLVRLLDADNVPFNVDARASGGADFDVYHDWKQKDLPADRLQRRLKALEVALEEALEFIEKYEDVVDGDYGEQKPNAAMSVGNSLREALGRRP
jgi:hypothetical protein